MCFDWLTLDEGGIRKRSRSTYPGFQRHRKDGRGDRTNQDIPEPVAGHPRSDAQIYKVKVRAEHVLVSRHASCVISRFTTKLLDALDAAAWEAQVSSESQFHCEKDNSSVTTGQDG